MLLLALFFIFLARYAKRNVWIVSSRCLARREVVHTKEVLALPPRDSLRKNVSLDSLNGTCIFFPVGPGGVVSARIQFPRQDKLWFILFASSKVCPAAPVFSILSEPARSTRLSRDLRFDPSVKFYSKSNTNIVWLREDLAF